MRASAFCDCAPNPRQQLVRARGFGCKGYKCRGGHGSGRLRGAPRRAGRVAGYPPPRQPRPFASQRTDNRQRYTAEIKFFEKLGRACFLSQKSYRHFYRHLLVLCSLFALYTGNLEDIEEKGRNKKGLKINVFKPFRWCARRDSNARPSESEARERMLYFMRRLRRYTV